MDLILYICVCAWISMASLFKKTGVKLEVLTDYNMILMIEIGD